MSDPSSPPAPKNPVVTAYDNFVRDTPLVSRYIMSACGICYLLSFVINPQFSLANIPYFSVYKLEVYRILVAPLLCDNIVSLVFAYFVVTDHVKRLEFSLGSTAFGVLFMTLNLLVNLSHIVVCLSLRLVLQNPSWALVPASGIWIVLLPLMATECLQSPGGASGGGGGVRKLFCWTVPAFYYPLILGALLGIMSGNLVPYALATAIGYAHGLQYLEPLTRRICPSEARCKQWEETVLSEFTTRQGFVPGHAAAGSAAWNDAAATASGGSGASVRSTKTFLLCWKLVHYGEETHPCSSYYSCSVISNGSFDFNESPQCTSTIYSVLVQWLNNRRRQQCTWCW